MITRSLQNLLDRNFIAAAPNRIWLADIYLRRPPINGWLYLAAVMDLYSRKIVGWAMQDHMRTELPLAALRMAISAQKPGAGPDPPYRSRRSICRGGTTAISPSPQAFRASMSRKADCYDNAPMESFFHTLKTRTRPSPAVCDTENKPNAISLPMSKATTIESGAIPPSAISARSRWS